MTITELKERIEKKEAQIERKQNTIAKKEAQIEKKKAKMAKMVRDDDRRWTEYEIESLEDDIRRNHEQIAEARQTLDKYHKQLAGEMEREADYINEVPEAMKSLEAKLNAEWNRYDKERKAWLWEQYEALGYKDFIKKHRWSGWEAIHKSDEEIEKENARDAKNFTLDLLNRVKHITGEVTDWSQIHLNAGNMFPVLNGFVIGKEGKAEVDSILAGGYNIQRLHVRVLVKEAR